MAVEKNNEIIEEEARVSTEGEQPEGMPVDVTIEGEEEVVEERPQDDFNANLAEDMDERDLKSMANEFAKDNIRINAVCIGKIKSAQWERRSKGGDIKKLYSDLGKTIPLGRVGEAEEYADLVAFLCSARASYITGAAINLDGGLCPSI